MRKMMMNRYRIGSLVKRLLFLNDNMHLSSYLVRIIVGAYVMYAVISGLTTGNKVILLAVAVYLTVSGAAGVCTKTICKDKSNEKK